MANHTRIEAKDAASFTTSALVEIDAVQQMIAYLLPQVAELSESAAFHLGHAQSDLNRVRSSIESVKLMLPN